MRKTVSIVHCSVCKMDHLVITIKYSDVFVDVHYDQSRRMYDVEPIISYIVSVFKNASMNNRRIGSVQ